MKYRLLLPALALVAGCSSRAPLATPAPAPVTTLAASPDRHFTSGDVTIRYRDFGSGGDPVILIHGFSRNLTDWSGTGDSLARGHRVIALDVRGHGQSDKPSGPLNYGRRMADDLVPLMDHLRIERAHLVGHSMGALIAAYVASHHSRRVLSVTLIAGPHYPDSATFIRETGRFITDMEQGRGLVNFVQWLFPGMPDQAAEQANAQVMRENDPALLLAIMRSMGGLAIGEGPRAVPAFLIAGDQDPLMPWSSDLGRRWRGSTVALIAGANHVTISLHPELLAGMRRIMANPGN